MSIESASVSSVIDIWAIRDDGPPRFVRVNHTDWENYFKKNSPPPADVRPTLIVSQLSDHEIQISSSDQGEANSKKAAA
jgi:hypothetical protein